jgi:energy-coupling factor transporter ATP-binding protein EcfA2
MSRNGFLSLAEAKRRAAAAEAERLSGGDGPGAPGTSGDEAECPVIALGQRAGVYYFLSVAGEIREMRPRDMTMLGLLSLFNGNPGWLYQHYAKLDKKDKPTGEVDVTAAAGAMMRRCAAVGLWRLDMPQRGIGVWRMPLVERETRGAIISHCGDLLFTFDKGRLVRKRAGVHLGHAVYVAAPAIDPPAEKPATAKECAELFGCIERYWVFAAGHLPRLTFGFIGLALLGAAPSWRVHVLLTGKRGAGKTGLLKYIRAALGPQANYTNDPTEAGLRELLTGEARTIVYDEAGGAGDGEQKGLRVDAIIGLLRRMADEEGAKSVRGTGSGAKHFTMAGSAALAAANPPALDAQDRSRILEVDMLTADPANKDAVEQAIAKTEKLAPALLARALAGWDRFNDNFAVFRQVLIDAKCDSRQADQLGTLFAAAEMMLSDEAISAEGAAGAVDALSEIITDYREQDEELSNARRCYAALMTAQIDHWKGGNKSTIGRLVQLARDPSRTSEREALRVYGLRLEETADGKEQELWVANVHRGLDRIFAGTTWANGSWTRALRQLPDPTPFDGGKPRQFDGHKSRFTVIPQKHLPDKPPPAPPVA